MSTEGSPAFVGNVSVGLGPWAPCAASEATKRQTFRRSAVSMPDLGRPWPTPRDAHTLRPGMRLSCGPFRLIVTLLLAVALPFCCCNFHSLLSVCTPCEAATHPAAADTAVHCHAAGSAHEHDADHHAEHAADSTVGGEPGSSPCGPGHDENDCSCGKQNTLTTVAKTTVDFPTPVLVAVVSFPTLVGLGVSNPFHTLGRDSRVSARPPTTLLYLHCALIV